MQIVAISHSRQPQKVWLKFDDSSYIPFKIDDLIVFAIKKFVDIDSDQFLKIQKASAKFILTEYALRQIAISPKVAKLLHQKMRVYSHNLVKKYNYSVNQLQNLIEVVIAEIESKGLLDELSFVQFYVRRHHKMSQMQIKYNLSQLGINYTDVGSDRKKLLLLLSKKINNLDLTDFNTKNKLIASFYRKGFAIDLVKSVIDELSNIS